MGTSLVVTVIGNDRPGIVERLSEVVLGAGANWEESRMARLAGKFAGILRISVKAANADALAMLRTIKVKTRCCRNMIRTPAFLQISPSLARNCSAFVSFSC